MNNDVVKQIIEAAESEIDTLLADFSVLENKYDLTKNNYTNQKKRFGIIPGGGQASEELLRNYVVNRIFTVRFVQNYQSRINADDKLAEASYILEDAVDKTIRQLSANKLGIPTIIRNINFNAIADPDYQSIENLLIMEVDFVIKYKNSITSC